MTMVDHTAHVKNYRGVGWDRRLGCWRLRICFSGKQRHLGYFKDELKAAHAYNKVLRFLYGDRAILNKLPQGVGPNVDDFKIPTSVVEAKEQMMREHTAGSAPSSTDGSAGRSMRTSTSSIRPAHAWPPSSPASASSEATWSGVVSPAGPAARQLPQHTLQDSYAVAPSDASSPTSMVSVLSSSSMQQQQQQQQHGLVAPAGPYGSTYGLQATPGLLQLPAVGTGFMQCSSSTVGACSLHAARAAPCSADADAGMLSHAQQLLNARVRLLQDGMLLPCQGNIVQQAGLVQASMAPPQVTSGSAGTYPLLFNAGSANTYPLHVGARNAGPCSTQMTLANAGAFSPQMTLVNPGACSTQFALDQVSTGPQQLTYAQAPMLFGPPASSGACTAAAGPVGLQVAPCMPYGVEVAPCMPYGVPVAPGVSCTAASASSAPGVIIGYVDIAGGQQMVQQQAPVQQGPRAAGYAMQQQACIQQGPSAACCVVRQAPSAGYVVQQQAPSAAGYAMQQQAQLQQFTGACSTGSAPAVWIRSPSTPMVM